MITWNYSVAAADVEYLAVGETKVETFDVTLEDGHGGDVTRTITITITGTNDAPVINSDNAAVTVNEGSPAGNTGTFSDADLSDTVTLSASIGTVTDTGGGTWSWSFNTVDGPEQSQTVTIYADDGHGPAVTTTFSLTVDNVAPMIALSGAATHNESAVTPYNLTVGPITDPGTDTVTSATVLWGDGTFTLCLRPSWQPFRVLR